MKKTYKHHNAFTLSETLIVFAVIGILAAILFPVIRKTVPDQNRVMFKKTYNILQEAIDRIANDETNYPTTSTGADIITGLTVQRVFNNTTATTNIAAGNTYNKFCYLLYNQLNVIFGGPTSCPLTGTYRSPWGTRTRTSDGAMWYMYFPYLESSGDLWRLKSGTDSSIYVTAYETKIIIDVNGFDKGPNCAADPGFNDTNPIGGEPTYAPSSTYTACVSADTVNDPCRNRPDTYAAGVRYDGKVEIGTYQGADACASSILSNLATN